MDKKLAILNAKLKEKLYTKIPMSEKNYNKEKYWLLKKRPYMA